MANNLEEFMSLVTGALSIKASRSLRVDEFDHSAHLCIRCICARQTSLDNPPTHRNIMTFTEVGSNVLPGAMHDVKQVSV